MVAGFQITALGWRIQREIVMEGRDERTWLTASDFLVGGSFLLLVGGVFAAPLLGGVPVDTAAKFFGLALTGFAASPFVLAGHYNLYCSWYKRRRRPRLTPQEAVVTVVTLALLGGYGAWWGFG